MAASSQQAKENNYAFMTCILRVNVRGKEWQKIVSAVLRNIQGISNFRMDEDGRIEVSGTVDPNLLLKMLAKAGKGAEICWWQFGQCSSNLFIPENRKYCRDDPYSRSGYYGDDSYYYGGSHRVGGGVNGFHSAGYGRSGHNLGDRYLHYEAYDDRPQPKFWYQPLEKPPADPGGKGRDLGGHGFPPQSVPPVDRSQHGEVTNCCSLM